jgi:hypothetical protein
MAGCGKEARRILIFNPLKRLVAVVASQLHAAKIIGSHTSAIRNACNGKLISCNKMYVRWWESDIEIDMIAELGQLTLSEYDELCGVERKTYVSPRMNRTGMKYIKENKKKANESKRRKQLETQST